MGYWKSKVLPSIKKVFETKPSKKTIAVEACKAFDDSKEEINKDFEEKKEELKPKVIEIYEACSAEIKTIVKAPTKEAVKKHSPLVNKFLEDLANIDFPGSKQVSEASAKTSPSLVSTSVYFIFEKVVTFLPPEPEAPTPAVLEPTTGEAVSKDKDVVVAPPSTDEEPSSTTVVTTTEAIVIEKIEEEIKGTPPPVEKEVEAEPAPSVVCEEEPKKEETTPEVEPKKDETVPKEEPKKEEEPEKEEQKKEEEKEAPKA